MLYCLLFYNSDVLDKFHDKVTRSQALQVNKGDLVCIALG